MTKIIQRHDTAANWTNVNPTLSQGEFGVEYDTGKFKIGDGQTAWNSLAYASSGGGEVTDLSGRVAAVEGEVAKKEDEITAIKPITLEKKVISSLKGMSYTSDGTRLYAQSTTTIKTDSNWFSPAITYNSPVSYIDIPLDINTDQVVTIPRFTTDYSSSQAVTFILGSYNADGLFYPIYFQAQGNPHNGYCWLISNDYPETVGTTSLSGRAVGGNIFGTIGSNTDKVYIQAKYDESSGFYIRTFGAFPDDSSTRGVQTTYTDEASIDRLRQITACRFVNMGKMGTSSTAVPSASFGRYDGAHLESGTLPDLTNIPNSFSLTGVQSSNYLQLNIGSGLSVVDGKLTASSTAPTNMVTTDTTQEITGSKLFPNGLKVGGYAGISDNNGEQFICVDPSHNGWTIGTQNSGGWFSDVHIKRGASGDYINIDSGNISEYVPYTITKLTQAEYNALTTKDENTIYIIVG